MMGKQSEQIQMVILDIDSMLPEDLFWDGLRLVFLNKALSYLAFTLNKIFYTKHSVFKP